PVPNRIPLIRSTPGPLIALDPLDFPDYLRHREGTATLMVVRVLRAASVLVCLTLGVTWAATFGSIVHIRGHVSDIALDESSGLLYAANFTANRIEKVATATSALGQPYFVGNQPSTLALSPDR